MPEQTVIVWDLETTPDLAAAARMLDRPNATDAEVREALGPGFLSIRCTRSRALAPWLRPANLKAGTWTRSVHLTSASDPRPT
jgi:hypothetical protein